MKLAAGIEAEIHIMQKTTTISPRLKAHDRLARPMRPFTGQATTVNNTIAAMGRWPKTMREE